MSFHHVTKAWICTKHMPWSRNQGTEWEATSQQFRAMDFCEKISSTASCLTIQCWPQRYVCRRSFKEVQDGKSWKFIPSSAT
ncbi:uncharacterized protein [Physcomitrium patens]|uniref:uncharacterized protein n=1 Tax=Physcomitrium patens TaxID=3218 RepID=UPI003CCE04E8